VPTNGMAAIVMFELAEFDKQRALLIGASDDPAEVDVSNLDVFIDDGALCYQRMLSVLHGYDLHSSPRDTKRWLKFARKSRRKLSKEWPMIQGGKSIKPTDEDYANIDREHPERSWTRRYEPLTSDEPTEDETREAAERLGWKPPDDEAAEDSKSLLDEMERKYGLTGEEDRPPS
jgi:hypothetical protein